MEVLNKPPTLFFVVLLALVSMFPLIQGQPPPQPTTFVVVSLGSTVLDFSWEAVTGDFDNYLIILYTNVGTPQQAEIRVVVDKTLTERRYVKLDPNINGVGLFTEKGNTRSARRDPTSSSVVSIAIPAPDVISETSSTVKVSWMTAPDPTYDIEVYEITLQQPVGTDILQQRVAAVAGASHTFENLQPGTEYAVVIKAFHPQGINIVTQNPISAVVWTIPHEPTEGLIYQTSATKATLTWTAANQPFHHYKLIITPPVGEPRVYDNIHPGTTSFLLDDILAQMEYGFKLQSVVNTPGYKDGMVESISSDIRVVYSTLDLNPKLEAITDHGMHLTWDPNTNAGLQKYTITVVDTNGNSVVTEDIPPGETSYTFPTLPATGAIYEYILNAYFDGTLQYAGSVQGSTKTPLNVELNGVTSNTATITWAKNIIPDPNSYLVSVISTDGTYNNLIPVQLNEAVGAYTITGLPAGKEYQIGVDAVKNGQRLEIGAIAQPAVLETSIKTDVVTTDLIQTSWDVIDGATYTLLLTNLADGTTRPVEISNSQTNKYVFTGLTPGQTYTVQLTGHLNGQSADGGTVTETTHPLPPQNIQVTQSASGTDTIVTWTPPENVYDGFGIQGGVGGVIQEALGPQQTQYTFSNFVDDGSNILLVSTSKDKLSLPGLPISNYNVQLGEPTSTSLKVSYDQFTGANGYHILLVNKDGTVHSEQVVDGVANTQYTFSGLSPSTEYTAVVSATNSQGAKQFIGSDTASTSAPVVLPPFNYDLNVNPVTTETMGITWKHNVAANFDNYRLTVVDAAGQFPAKTYTIPAGANPNQLVTGLNPGTEYSIDVSGVANGVVTTVDSARQSTVPEPPLTTIMSHADDKITLSWFPPLHGTADNYIIKYGPYGGTLEEVVLGSNANNYEILQPFDNSQQYKVEIYSAVGPSQELISEKGTIIQTGVPNIFNPTCDPNPCLNNGMCRIEPAIGFVCTCTSGFTGNICQTPVVIDFCLVNNCVNGVCVNGAAGYTCNCAGTDFTGVLCDERVDNCVTGICQNGGTCRDDTTRVGEYICTCVPGYIGKNCETDINECLSNPCMNSGVCFNEVNRYRCDCSNTDYSGDNCETRIDACLVNPCENGGTCVDGIGQGVFTCNCDTGYSGATCTNDPNDCLSNPCMNGGKCVDNVGFYTCLCDTTEYNGQQCEIKIDQCLSAPCLNEGDCVDGISRYTCNCKPGFQGTNCEFTIDFCLVSECVNGVCVSGANGFTCNCAGTDFTGAQCEERVDNCVVGICQNGGICRDDLTRPGEYTCTCAPGYTGKNCETNINECASNPCLNNGVCTDGINRFTCDCSLIDYVGDRCQNRVDNCLPFNPCLNGGTCVDSQIPGTYNCNCVAGYSGKNCSIVNNECDSAPCLNGGRCIDGDNRYTCDCSLTDFSGDQCQNKINDCTPTNPCQNGGFCTDGTDRGDFSCQCAAGYTGPTCSINDDECGSNPCLNGGKCIDRVNSFTCDCSGTDFEGDRCQTRINNCPAINPCNNGVCVDGTTPEVFTCNCDAGYTGFYCNNQPNECDSNPCLNNGVCQDGTNRYTCICAGTDYTGVRCETKINNCAVSPCLNEGVCVDGVLTYTCNCKPGFQGTNCELNFNECISRPCLNSGTCQDMVNSYGCTCASGFSGPTCAININECLSNPCLNDGTCVDGANGYTCNCLPTFNGLRCETNTNQCINDPCNKDNSVCIDGDNMYVCRCFPGYEGPLCNQEINECLSSPCKNGGTCVNRVLHYICTCLSMFQGVHCEIAMSSRVEITTMEPTSFQGVFSDIMPDNPNAVYEVAILDSQGVVKETKTYRRQDVVNGMIPFGFTDLQPGTDYNVRLTVNDGTQVFPLETLNVRTTTICTTNVCINGGTCVEEATAPMGYLCTCAPGYEGRNCESDINECTSAPCANSGFCQNLVNLFQCICTSQWKGLLCTIPVTVNFVTGQTTPQSIQVIWNQPIGTIIPKYEVVLMDTNGGIVTTGIVSQDKIVNGAFDFIFHAPQPGTNYISRLYALEEDGTRVELAMITPSSAQICSTGPCENNGVCVDNRASSLGYICNCSPGYTGENCQNDIDECLSNPCRNIGRCINGINAFSCSCAIGWMGPSCSVPSSVSFSVGDVTTSTVQVRWPNILMEPGTNFYYKIQTTDAAGHTQTQNIQPVPNVGPNYMNSYVIPNLLPSTQYEVSLVVVTDNNEHTVGTQVPTTKSVCTELLPCQNGGVCIVQPTLVERYSCICPDGWTNVNCDQDVPECASNPCQNGGQCQEHFQGYTCQCSTQYQGRHCQVSTSNILQLTGMTATDAQFTFTPLNNNDVLVYYLSIRDDVTQLEKTQALTPEQVRNGVIDQAFFGLTPNNKYTTALTVQMTGETELLNLGQREVTTPNACAAITCLNNGVCVPDINPPLYYTCNCVQGFTGALCGGDENNCAGNPCANGGQCVDRQGSYLCTCVSGFTGQNCQININECASNPCATRGRCVDGVNGFTCNCFSGYTGTFCSTAIDECASEPCLNGGLCRDDTNRFFCNCSPGYTGVYCQQNIDECASNPCLNNAACIDQVNRYICTCQLGFFGTNCGDAFDTCASNPCMNGGQCRDFQSSFTCSCSAPYSGLRCEIAPNVCDSSPCTNGGTCIGFSSSYFCLCLARWQGLNCELAVSPCENRPCRNGGACVALTTGFRCDCLSGYTGEICDMNIDDCASSPCQGNGVCMDQLNGYVCVCFSGFTGVNCITDTSACSNNPCQNNGFCLASGSQYFCVCSPMWTGRNCEQSLDQQECASNPCLNGGTCLERFSAYECVCTQGFTGTSCERDINECVNLNMCQNGGTCINSIGSFQCLCVTGYEGPMCQIITLRCTLGYCMNGGICQEQFNTRICNCIPGFEGTRCETQVNFCASITCQNGGQCVSAVNTYNCQCIPGYGGTRCEINIDNCIPNPCNNGGQCQDGVNTATCICPSGYTGNTCLININDCSTPNLCLNGGTCVDGLGSYSCSCVSGYTGNRCQTDVPECASNPCLNRGVCIEQLNMYFCQCQVGFQGTRCEIAINTDECLSNPCLNNGRCLDGQNLYTCQCLPGYIGTRCQTDLNECDSSPCQNQGRCVNSVNSFSCICQGGYTGSLCTVSPCTSHQCQNGGQCVVLPVPNSLGYSCSCPSTHTGSFCQTLIDVDLCRPINPCMNGGNCIDGINTYNCVCQPGYSGRICQTDIDECASRPCQNGGGCTNGVNNYVCTCSSQFTGRQCETRIYTPCQPDPCLNFGTCNVVSTALNMYACICFQGYTGARCEIPPPTLCQRSPCQNGGTCIAQGTSAYRCACLSYYTGQNCELVVAIDPCTSNPCRNGGQCSRSNNGPVVYYSCTCFNGYVGLNCETRPNPCTSNPCLNGGLCALLNNNNFGFFCNCVNGYTGINCQTANPCISNPCTNGGTCSTQSNQGVVVYVCQCIVGYTGERCTTPPQNPCNSQPCLNGGQCSTNQLDVTAYFCTCRPNYFGNRCELRNDPCVSSPCLNGGRCTSQQNGNTFTYLCQCISGYTGIQCSTPPTNPCISQPCRNGGVCNRVNNFQFTCQCRQYYTGSTCEISSITPCTVNPCTNGGTCYIMSSSFTCDCVPGYSGSTCLILSVCATNPCQNGGACSQMPSNPNQYRCSCQFGWTGTNCNTPLPTACTNNPCLNQGFCIVTGPSSYMCNCRNGYTGNVCNIIVACNPNPCLNGGQCSATANNILNPFCTCTQSFTGNRCQIPITTPCSNNPCLNGGTCTATGSSSYMCSCPVGYMGANCQTLGACNPSPCINGGTCMINYNNPSDYFCDCLTGYTGNRCQFASPTPCSSNPCLNGGACSNLGSTGYTCQCRAGYTGNRCTTMVACISNPCQNNGLCTINNVNPNQFVCSCQPNFSGTFCQIFVPPVTVCTVNPCLNSGTCIQDASVNTGYRCQCTSGYMGTNCAVQITLCSPPCTNDGNCVFDQIHSVYTCSCSEQFAGTQCQLSSSCSAEYTLTEGQEVQITSPNYPYNYMDNLNCLYNIMASSTDRRVSFVINDLETECDRDIVQIGHGSNPADVASMVMRESGSGLIAPFFVDDSNVWLTFKSDNWQTGKGFSISVKDVPLAGAVVSQCDAGLCANGGLCAIHGVLGSIYCVCRAGFNGDRCEMNVDECSSSPCQFGGECSDVINGYICICTGGRQGLNCEVASSSQCQGAVCLNGGTCHPLTDGSYVCSCVPQFTGSKCQQTVQGTSRSCQSNPCFNGGVCVDTIDGTFLCICSQSYTGTLCESAVALCARSPPPCFNGGTCSDSTGSIVCRCHSGYIGTFCELATQDCICQNGGICFGANNCICSKGFAGQFCEVNINECLSRPCLNGGSCIDGENFFSCVCLTGYSGSTCSQRDPNTSQLKANGVNTDGTNTAASTGQTLGIGWIILISVLALLLLLLLVFIALRSWKSYDNRYYEDKNHLTDYEENNRFVDSQPREMEMGNILLPQTGATNVTHLNAREEPWPVSTDEMPTSNI